MWYYLNMKTLLFSKNFICTPKTQESLPDTERLFFLPLFLKISSIKKAASQMKRLYKNNYSDITYFLV